MPEMLLFEGIQLSVNCITIYLFILDVMFQYIGPSTGAKIIQYDPTDCTANDVPMVLIENYLKGQCYFLPYYSDQMYFHWPQVHPWKMGYIKVNSVYFNLWNPRYVQSTHMCTDIYQYLC